MRHLVCWSSAPLHAPPVARLMRGVIDAHALPSAPPARSPGSSPSPSYSRPSSSSPTAGEVAAALGAARDWLASQARCGAPAGWGAELWRGVLRLALLQLRAARGCPSRGGEARAVSAHVRAWLAVAQCVSPWRGPRFMLQGRNGYSAAVQRATGGAKGGLGGSVATGVLPPVPGLAPLLRPWAPPAWRSYGSSSTSPVADSNGDVASPGSDVDAAAGQWGLGPPPEPPRRSAAEARSVDAGRLAAFTRLRCAEMAAAAAELAALDAVVAADEGEEGEEANSGESPARAAWAHGVEADLAAVKAVLVAAASDASSPPASSAEAEAASSSLRLALQRACARSFDPAFAWLDQEQALGTLARMQGLAAPARPRAPPLPLPLVASPVSPPAPSAGCAHWRRAVYLNPDHLRSVLSLHHTQVFAQCALDACLASTTPSPAGSLSPAPSPAPAAPGDSTLPLAPASTRLPGPYQRAGIADGAIAEVRAEDLTAEAFRSRYVDASLPVIVRGGLRAMRPPGLASPSPPPFAETAAGCRADPADLLPSLGALTMDNVFVAPDGQFLFFRAPPKPRATPASVSAAAVAHAVTDPVPALAANGVIYAGEAAGPREPFSSASSASASDGPAAAGPASTGPASPACASRKARVSMTYSEFLERAAGADALQAPDPPGAVDVVVADALPAQYTPVRTQRGRWVLAPGERVYLCGEPTPAPVRAGFALAPALLPPTGEPLTSTLLWVAMTGQTTPLHFDLAETMLAQAHGVKRVLLFPPAATPLLRPFPVHHPHDRQSRLPDPLRPHRALAGFPGSDVAGLGGALGAGDVLYMPYGWWHHVWSEGPTVSLSYRWNPFAEFVRTALALRRKVAAQSPVAASEPPEGKDEVEVEGESAREGAIEEARAWAAAAAPGAASDGSLSLLELAGLPRRVALIWRRRIRELDAGPPAAGGR